jgi:hypothetical protein
MICCIFACQGSRARWEIHGVELVALLLMILVVAVAKRLETRYPIILAIGGLLMSLNDEVARSNVNSIWPRLDRLWRTRHDEKNGSTSVAAIPSDNLQDLDDAARGRVGRGGARAGETTSEQASPGRGKKEGKAEGENREAEVHSGACPREWQKCEGHPGSGRRGTLSNADQHRTAQGGACGCR